MERSRSQTRLYITGDLNFKTIYHLYVCRHRATHVAGYRFPSPSPPRTRVARTTPRKASRGSALSNFPPCQRSSMMQRRCVRIGASSEVAQRLADLPFPYWTSLAAQRRCECFNDFLHQAFFLYNWTCIQSLEKMDPQCSLCFQNYRRFRHYG